jgi:hypothetical protein
MNRQLKLSRSAVSRTIGAIGLCLSTTEKKKLADKTAKVYVIYDGETIEAHLIDFDMKGVNQFEKAARTGSAFG